MNKKLILLIMCLPLILMISLFSVSKTVTLSINVPVSKIEIFSESVVYMDLGKDEKYLVDYTVYPTNANNKEVYLTTEKVGNSPLAELEYVNGKIVAKSCGKAKVYLTTVDGGYRDSFVVEVYSTSLQSIECEIESKIIYIDESTQINTTFIPEGNTTLLNYIVKDGGENVVSVNPAGVVTGKLKGVAEIMVQSAKYENIIDTVTVEVKNRGIIDFEEKITTWDKDGAINISLDVEEECTYTSKAYNQNGELLDSSKIDLNFNYDNIANGVLGLNYNIKDKTFIGSVFVEITALTESGFEFNKTCEIECINHIIASWSSSTQSNSVNLGREIYEMFTINPGNAEVVIEYEHNDNIAVELKTINNIKALTITGKKLGTTTLKVKIFNANNIEDDCISLEKEIVVKTDKMTIAESTKTYGIENVLAIGKTDVDGTTSIFGLSISNAGENFAENITWEADSSNVTIDNAGNITLIGENVKPELVGFKALFDYNGIKYESNVFKIKCVYDGVNVRSYKDLWQATNYENPNDENSKHKPIILHTDIKDDFAKGVDNYYKTITTTYDKTYYDNIGASSQAKIKILIEFKNDVYGNGHYINAHNVAWKKNLQNSPTNPVFGEPLNFVAMSENGGLISVKAQDNVCFAIYENVTITNIELKGCDLEPDKNGKYDLTDLTYTGTTVEVFGDNVTIQYSRISNGRTVLRAFGDIEDSTKNIHLNIKNSVLSGAREFILRLGTNCFVEGTKEEVSPCLPNDNIKTFPAQKNYQQMSKEEKEEYDNLFIKTFVNVKNSVFKDAGIFAIGLDAHFAGPALEDGGNLLGGLVKDWKDLAKTSYGVKLTFEGEVKLYTWKDIKDVDSSTLISKPEITSFEGLDFNVAEMLETLSKNPKFKDIVCKQKNEDGIDTEYVHAGIAFFGGGKNYSVFEDANYSTYDLNGYEIKLSEVNKAMLQTAAGNESFYFLLNDSTTYNFLPDKQAELLSDTSGIAYSCIYEK